LVSRDYVVAPEELAALDRELARPVSSRSRGHKGAAHEVTLRTWKSLNQRRFELPELPQAARKMIKLGKQLGRSTDRIAAWTSKHPQLSEVLMAAIRRPDGLEPPGNRRAQLAAAVRSLGPTQAANMVVAAAIRQSLFQGANQQVMDDLWRAAVGSGISMSLVAQAADRHVERAFILGLLHEVGKPVLASIVLRVLQDFPDQVTYREVAPSIFRLMHCRAAFLLIRHWDLPHGLADLAARHHDPAPSRQLRTATDMLRLAAATSELCGERQRPPSQYGVLLGHRLVRDLHIERDTFKHLLALYPGAVASFLSH